MSFLSLIPLRVWLYLAAALAIAGLLWREHHVVGQRNAALQHARELTTELAQAQNTLKRQEKASNDYHDELERLQSARAATPARVVRLCHSAAASVPEATSGIAAPGGDGLPEAVGSHPRDRWSDDGPDVGPELYDLADKADQCAAQRDALIRWAEGR